MITGYYTADGFMGNVNGEYMLFADEYDQNGNPVNILYKLIRI